MMDSDPSSHNAIQQALYSVLKALARIALRYGISAGAMSELVRRAYVDAAEEGLLKEGKKTLTSRLCALTGLYRKEIVRVKALPPIAGTVLDDRYNRSARVVTGWLRDTDFLTKRGKPAVLAIEGSGGFQALVKRYSGDMTPRAMLEELERLQVIEMTSQNRVRLIERAYVPSTSDLDTIQILGTDTADLIETIHHNLDKERAQRLYQRKVSYAHIPEKHVEAFRQVAALESQALLERLDRWLARHDTEPRSDGKAGARLGLGIYQFNEHHPVDLSDRDKKTESSIRGDDDDQV